MSDDDFVWVESQSGENWHEFVLWTIDQGFGGLWKHVTYSGNVGTTPVQNIGATAQKLKTPWYLATL
jgi:UDP-N-acetylmuramate dehydrogenase